MRETTTIVNAHRINWVYGIVLNKNSPIHVCCTLSHTHTHTHTHTHSHTHTLTHTHTHTCTHTHTHMHR